MKRLIAMALMFTIGLAPIFATTYTPADEATLRSNLASAVCGDTIVLHAGTTYVNSVLGYWLMPAKAACGAGIYVRITSDGACPAAGSRVTAAIAASTTWATLSTATYPAIAFAFNGDSYQFDCLEITNSWTTTFFPAYEMVLSGYDGADTGTWATTKTQLPDHIIFDRVYAHGHASGDTKIVFYLSMQTATVKGSFIEQHSLDSDSNCILNHDGAGPYLIDNNELLCTGENFISAAVGAGIVGQNLDGLVFTNNLVRKDPASRGGFWDHNKNLFELKRAINTVVDHNIFEYNWPPGQPGDAIVINVRNQNDTCPWCVISNLTFTNNIIRHTANCWQLLGEDYVHPTPRGDNWTFSNNLCYDANATTWGVPGASGNLGNFTSLPTNLTWTHNTVDTGGGTDSGYLFRFASPEVNGGGFVFRDNLGRHGQFGLPLTGGLYGTASLAAQYPGGYTWDKNVVAGISAAGHFIAEWPTGTVNITDAALTAGWSNPSAGDYRLVLGAEGYGTGTAGADKGVNMCALPDPAGDGKATFNCVVTPPSSSPMRWPVFR